MPDSERVTQHEAGRRLGITAQAIGVWCRKPGAPVGVEKGKPYCLWPEFPRWRESELRRQVVEESKPKDLADSQARKLAAEAIKAELEVERIRGNILDIDLHGARLREIIAQLRAKVLASSGKYCHRTVGIKTLAESQAVWDDCVRDILTALSETRLQPPTDEEAA